MSITAIGLAAIRAETRAALIDTLADEFFAHVEACKTGCGRDTTCPDGLAIAVAIESTRNITLAAARVA